MAADNSSFNLFLSKSNAENVKVDIDTVQQMNAEINSLRLALKASEDALLAEKEQKVKDRKLFEAKISDYRKRCIEYCEKLNQEHYLKSKDLENGEKEKTSGVSYCDQSAQALPLVQEKCVQTSQHSTTNQAQQTEIIDPDALVYDEVDQLKRMIAQLVYTNNRYHLAISNCTHCMPDDAISEISFESSDVLIRASTPVPGTLPSPAHSSPASILMSSTEEDMIRQPSVMEKKDQVFVDRMKKVLTKLEAKYLTPQHKRKKRLFARKTRISHIVPREFSKIYHNFAAPELQRAPVPEPYPHVNWNMVKFKPVLPNPEPCPIYSCSQDPEFYQDKDIPCTFKRWAPHSFGTLPGFNTSLGIVAVPTAPVGGYVYCPSSKKWVIHASSSAGMGAKGGGLPSSRRKKG